MLQKILAVLLFLATVEHCSAVKCYHCYDLYKGSKNTFDDSSFDGKLVKCSEKQKDWNSWDCPPDWPVCVIISRSSNISHEVVRTCAVKGFCSLYVPQDGVKMESCRECSTPLCNDITDFPDPPEGLGPQFVFNINLHVNKYSLGNSENNSDE